MVKGIHILDRTNIGIALEKLFQNGLLKNEKKNKTDEHQLKMIR